ncbi:MAG: efflux RND transporter periplasmic adaptor subunit [Coleofasciculaceae cyanobacterium]
MAEVGVSLRKKYLNPVVLLLFLISACSSGAPQSGAKKPSAVPVKLQTVEQTTLLDTTEQLGSLEAENRVDLRPETEGRVNEIFVSSGSSVSAGMPILQLRPEKSQAEVGGAVANVNAAIASRSNAEAQIKAVEAQRVSDTANVDLQEQQFKRISSLVAQGALPKQQLDQVRRDRDAARAALNATDEKIRAARATLDQQNAQLKQAQSTVASRQEDLRETRVVAPIAGVVGNVAVKVGDYVKTTDILTSIIQNQNLDLSISISTDKTNQLRLGLPVQLLNQNGEEVISTGRISFISPQVNQDQQILAKASFPNSEGKLRDGQRVRARVVWQKNQGVSVPATAVTRIAGENFVFVAQPPADPKVDPKADPKADTKLIAKQKLVKLGDIQGNNYQVITGLKPGEKIVVSGLLNLTDGAPIIPQAQPTSSPQSSPSP